MAITLLVTVYSRKPKFQLDVLSLRCLNVSYYVSVVKTCLFFCPYASYQVHIHNKQTTNIVLSLQFFKGVIGNKNNNIVSLSTKSPVAPDNYISKVLRCFSLIHKTHQDILWSSSQKLSMFCEFDFCHILGM